MMVLCFRGAGEWPKDSGHTSSQNKACVYTYVLPIADSMGELIKQPKILTSFLSIVYFALLEVDIDPGWCRPQRATGQLLALTAESTFMTNSGRPFSFSLASQKKVNNPMHTVCIIYAKYATSFTLNKTQSPILLLLRNRSALWHVVQFGQPYNLPMSVFISHSRMYPWAEEEHKLRPASFIGEVYTATRTKTHFWLALSSL